MGVNRYISILLALASVAVMVLPERLLASQSDEFVGPFKSWLNVKSFGAQGDGSADDTAAIQNALNTVGLSGKSPVLYFPSGTYIVSNTIGLYGGINISLVGQDPSNTIIRWNGPSGGTLLHIDGVAYSHFMRLAIDASSLASVGVEQCNDGQAVSGRGSYFDTGNEYSDMIFEGATGFGLRAGQCGNGASEGTIIRSQFIKNGVGFETVNANTLDWWIWYSTFLNNGVGATNIAGAYHVYNSLFENSSFADVHMHNVGNFNYRGNTSINSGYFLFGDYYYTNGTPTIMEANQVFNPTNSGGLAAWEGTAGALTMIDNILTTPSMFAACKPSANNIGAGCAVTSGDQNGADMFSVGNIYTIANVLGPGYGATSGTRLLEQNDQVASLSSLN